MSAEPKAEARGVHLRDVLFVVRCTISAALAYWLGARLGLEFPAWASVSAIVVCQEKLSDTESAALHRLIATIVGVLIAAISASLIQYLGFGIMVQMALGVAVASAVARRWPQLRVAMWTVPIIFFAGGDPHSPVTFGLWRGAEVLLGGLCGALLHFFAEKIFSVLTPEPREQA